MTGASNGATKAMAKVGIWAGAIVGVCSVLGILIAVITFGIRIDDRAVETNRILQSYGARLDRLETRMMREFGHARDEVEGRDAELKRDMDYIGDKLRQIEPDRRGRR